ncbi:MAG: hypothetical protein U0360_08020 [Dehalococcoidia bacterium]
MTKQTTSAAERARRRELVTLSVVASSALALAGTWVGITAVDGTGATTAVMAPLPSVAPAAASTSGGSLVQAPAQRPITVVRRSRAS